MAKDVHGMFLLQLLQKMLIMRSVCVCVCVWERPIKVKK